MSARPTQHPGHNEHRGSWYRGGLQQLLSCWWTSEPTIRASGDISNIESVQTSMDTISDKDVVIMVLGPAGVGKTSFINAVAGKQNTGLKVARRLTSGTKEISCVKLSNIPVPLRGGSLVLVDTPGFDNSNFPDWVVLDAIATWLANLYRAKKPVSGIIYLERITDAPFSVGPSRSLEVFKHLYGRSEHSRIGFVTTHWNEALTDVADFERARYQERYLTSDAWTFFLKEDAAHVGRFNSTTLEGARSDARAIVEQMISIGIGKRPLMLQIQEELVEKRMSLHRTQAGKVVFTKLGGMEYCLRRLLGLMANTTV